MCKIKYIVKKSFSKNGIDFGIVINSTQYFSLWKILNIFTKYMNIRILKKICRTFLHQILNKYSINKKMEETLSKTENKR